MSEPVCTVVDLGGTTLRTARYDLTTGTLSDVRRTRAPAPILAPGKATLCSSSPPLTRSAGTRLRVTPGAEPTTERGTSGRIVHGS